MLRPKLPEIYRNFSKKRLTGAQKAHIILKLEAEAARFSLAVFRHRRSHWQKLFKKQRFFMRVAYAARCVFVLS